MLSNEEARYLLTLYTGTKPSNALPFKADKRSPAANFKPSTAGNFQLLEFKARSVSGHNASNTKNVTCTLDFNNSINCDMEISEIQFCQWSDSHYNGITSVEIDDKGQGPVSATSIVKLRNQEFTGHPVYTASFEEPFRFSPQRSKLHICFKLNQKYDAIVTKLQACTAYHLFKINGRNVQVSFRDSTGPQIIWHCLLALKGQCIE